MDNSDKITLAHRRLSILDFSPSGHQTMKSEEERYIVFNGEIYSYKELEEEHLRGEVKNSKSDIEVLLKMSGKYGVDCLNNLNGMWSFIYCGNKNKNLLYLEYRLSNFSFSLSFSNETKEGCLKSILGDGIKEILPEEVWHRKDKKRYHAPINSILDANPSIKKHISENLSNDERLKWRYISFNVWGDVYNI